MTIGGDQLVTHAMGSRGDITLMKSPSLQRRVVDLQEDVAVKEQGVALSHVLNQ